MAGLAKLQLLIDIKEKLNVGLNKAKQKVDRAVNGMQRKLNSISLNTTQAFGAIQNQIPALSGSLGMLANPYTAIAAGVAALGAGIVKSTTMANDWHKQMAEINVTAELSKDKLKNLSDQLLKIGSRNVAPLEEVPKAFNRIISAGLSVNDSLKTLEPTLRAAKAGFTDIETVASAATSVMMSTGLEANKVFDILFQTVKDGNAEFKDIAQYLPKVIPLAKNVGYELEQVSGAFAVLTGRMSAEQSTTALQGVMRALSSQRVAIGQIDKATGKYVSGFKSIGIEVFDPATNKVKSLLDIAKELESKLGGLSDKERMLQFDKLGLDQMGAMGFATLMQNIPALENSMKSMYNAQGALNKAYLDSLTPLESWKIIQNELKAQMIKIGELFLPIVSAIGTKILDIINYWKDLYNNSLMFRDLLSGIGSVFGWLFKLQYMGITQIINIVKILYNVISSVVIRIGDWIAKVMGLKGGFKELYNTIRPYLIWMKEFLSSIGDLMYDIFTFNIDGAYDKINNFKLPNLKDIKQKILVEADTDADSDFSGVPTGTNPTGAGALTPDAGNAAIADGARSIKGNSQTKNITINIDSFIKGFTPTHQSFNNLSMDEMERKMTEVFMRVVRSAEIAM